MFFRALPFLLLLSPAALAQVDGGTPDTCDPRCEGAVLHYCDGELPVLLDCATLDARCGELSPAWGDDCLLSAGAPCEPGYAFDESRCDRAASLFCVDGACAVASGPQSPPVLEPSASSGSSTDSSSDEVLDCSSCSSTSAAGLFVLAGALGRLRRLRRS
ncbi:MAG: hypothetical protein IT382_07920 [Deltaproteobacteria bacterium]|nr:hypothetical protein [Deltaproteobacteria bacterium]